VSSGVLARDRDTVHQARQILTRRQRRQRRDQPGSLLAIHLPGLVLELAAERADGELGRRPHRKEAYLVAPKYAAGFDMMRAFKETFVAAGGKVVGEDYTPFPVNEDLRRS